MNLLISRSHSLVRPSRLEEFQTKIFNFLEKPKCKSGSDLISSPVRSSGSNLIVEIWSGISWINRFWSWLWKVAGLYHTVSMCIMLLCLLITIFSTIRQYEEMFDWYFGHTHSKYLYFKFTKLKKEISLSILFYIESIILMQYATEFILRLFSCGCKAKFHGFKGRFRFMRQFFPLLG